MTHNHHFVKATVLYVEHRQTNKSSLNQARLKHTVFDFINNNNNSIIGKLSYLFVLWEWTRGVRRHLSSSFTRRASNFSKLAATFLPFCFSSYFFSNFPTPCVLFVRRSGIEATNNRQQSSYKSGGKEEKLNFVRVAKSCGLLWSFGAESSNATETTAAVDERPRQRIGKRERERGGRHGLKTDLKPRYLYQNRVKTSVLYASAVCKKTTFIHPFEILILVFYSTSKIHAIGHNRCILITYICLKMSSHC